MAKPAALKSLSLTAFRGSASTFVLNFETGKKLTLIYGENGTGKTTICDAFEFLAKDNVGSLDGKGLSRESAIRHALDLCDKIEIVIAHTGEGITANAAKAIKELLADKANIDPRLASSVRGCMYEERKAYKHSEFAMAFVFAKQFRQAIDGNHLIDVAKLKSAGSAPYDTLRQHLWDIMQTIPWPGPLAISKNQDHTLNVIRRLMIRQYDLKGDQTIKALRAKNIVGQPYQVDLFKYLASKSTQVGNIV